MQRRVKRTKAAEAVRLNTPAIFLHVCAAAKVQKQVAEAERTSATDAAHLLTYTYLSCCLQLNELKENSGMKQVWQILWESLILMRTCSNHIHFLC